MANRYWVGGTDTWNAAVSSKWASTSGGAGGQSVPTAADDVFFDAASGSGVVTATGALSTARSINFTGFTGTFSYASQTISIGDGTAGAGNNALIVGSGMSFTTNSISTFALISTSATQQNVDFGGKTMNNITINGAGSSYLFTSSLTTNGNAALTLTTGTLDTGNQTINAGIFSSNNSNTRTLTLGSSAITLSGTNTNAWVVNSTNLTISSNTAVVTLTGANGTIFNTQITTNYNGLSVVFNGALINGGIGGVPGTAITLKDLTFTGTAVKTNVAWISGNVTCTGTFTLNGNSVTNRYLLATPSRGTGWTLTAATVTVTNADFMDITGAGAGSWNLASITGNSGDCGGNSGITMTTPATQTNTGATGSWSDSTKWTSRVPLPQDDVVINTGSGTITVDMPRLGKGVDFTGFTGTASFNTTTELYGSLTLASGMTLGAYTQAITLAGRSSYTVTSAGKQFSNQIQFNGYGGTYTLQDALYTTQAIAQYAGTFDTNNQTVTCLTFATSGTITRALTFGTSTINLIQTTATTVWSIGSTGLTMSAASSTIVISTASGNTRVFSSGNQTYGTIDYTVANSGGALNITGSSTYGTINLGAGRGLIPNASGTYGITGSITGSGSPVSYVYMPGDSYGASVPDSANTSIANDIDIRLRVALDDVSKAGGMRIAAKYGAAGQRSWRWYVSTGQLVFETSSDGTNTAVAANATATLAAAGLSSGTTYWLRVARDKAAGTVKFYYAADSTSVPTGGSWTQIGSTLTSMSTAATFDSTALTTVGGETSGVNSDPGKYYRFQVCSNLADDGSAVQIDADFTAKTFGADTFTESSSNAATVTMANNSVFGDGRLQIYSGTPNATFTKPSGGPIMTSSDYVVVQYIKVNQPLSFFAGANGVNNGNNSGVYFTAPGTYRYRQGVAGPSTSGTSISATYPTATTSGNLLVAEFMSAGTQGATFTPPSGWTQAISSSNSTIVYIYYKIADGTETSVTFSQTTLRVLDLTLSEYSGFSGTPTADVTDLNDSGASVTSISTTSSTGPTNTAQPALAFAYVGAGASLSATVSTTNSFVEDFTTSVADLRNKSFVKELTTTAAVDTTITWTTSRPSVAIGLAVFKNVSATGNLSSFFEVF